MKGDKERRRWFFHRSQPGLVAILSWIRFLRSRDHSYNQRCHTVIHPTSIARLGQSNNLRNRHSKVLLFRSANLSDIQPLSRADKLELVKDWIGWNFSQSRGF
jgi:hypothetical protein